MRALWRTAGRFKGGAVGGIAAVRDGVFGGSIRLEKIGKEKAGTALKGARTPTGRPCEWREES